MHSERIDSKRELDRQISSQLRILLNTRGIKCYHAAEVLGVTKGCISAMLTRRPFPRKHFLKLAEHFQFSDAERESLDAYYQRAAQISSGFRSVPRRGISEIILKNQQQAILTMRQLLIQIDNDEIDDTTIDAASMCLVRWRESRRLNEMMD